MKFLLIFVVIMAGLLTFGRSGTAAVAAQAAETKCPVHHIALVEGQVPVIYRLVEPYAMGNSTQAEREHSKLLKEYLDAKRDQFPETHRWENLGCIVGAETETTGVYCEKCREAEDKWLAEHPNLTREERQP